MYGKLLRMMSSNHIVGQYVPVEGRALENIATLVVHAESALASEAQRESQ